MRKMLRNDQMGRIQRLPPGKATDGFTAKDDRLFVEADLWIVRTGSPWRDFRRSSATGITCIPASRWGKSGVWRRVVERVGMDVDLEACRG